MEIKLTPRDRRKHTTDPPDIWYHVTVNGSDMGYVKHKRDVMDHIRRVSANNRFLNEYGRSMRRQPSLADRLVDAVDEDTLMRKLYGDSE